MSSLKMKKFKIKGVIDNIRQSVNTPSPPGSGSSSGPVKLESDLIENLASEKFTAEDTVRHGFPNKALSVDFDPIQKILAMGTRYGIVKIFGRPGIDTEFKHENEVAVMQLQFIINSGKLLTACTDDSINLWDFTKKDPELVQSLKLNKERLTVMNLEFQDKWLYIGTERGNVLIMNMDTFTLSGYIISWNKCIDPLQKNHPGAVSHLSANPADNSKLLIGYRSGLICLWDLASKKGEQRYNYNQVLHSISWHMEGRQFVCSYGDGSLVTWNVKPQAGNKPQSVQFPHGKKNKETGKVQPCDPIEKVLWRVNRSSGDNYFVFSGGLPHDVTGTTPCITFMQGKNTTVLEMENTILDFLLVTDSPFLSDYQEPEAIIVMQTNDLVAIDCKSSGFPCFKNPYSMDFNESPVTFCRYLVDCSSDLIPALYLVGSRSGKSDGGGSSSSKGASTREWPISGGVDSATEACSYSELLITGHADGSVKFWDASSTSMQSLYKVKTAKYFEKTKKTLDSSAAACLDEDPYAICQIALAEESRELAVAGASGQVIFFRFRKKETSTETKAMEIPIVYEVSHHAGKANHKDDGSPPQAQHFEFPTPKPLLNVASQSAAYTDPVDGFNFDKPQYEYFSPLKFRTGSQKKHPGFHAELVCLTPWVNNDPPTQISCIALNSNYGLLAYGNGSGLVIVDVIQFVCLLNMGTADLYGANDPFQRLPKSPKPLGGLSDADIVRVDLSSYSQVVDTPSVHGTSAPTNKSIERVKSPDPKSKLQKALSLVDDGSFAKSEGISSTKSRSSSSSSLDQMISCEGVTHLEFVDSFTAKNDFSSLNSSLYVGTTLGSFIAIVINLPDKGDARLKEPVVVSPSGSIYRLRGPVLSMAFLDCSSGSLMTRSEPAENVKSPAKKSTPSPTGHPSLSSVASSSNSGSHDEKSPPSNSSGDQQLAVVCTEKCAGVFALPSQRQMYSQSITESNGVAVVSAEVINFGGPKYNPCLVAFTSDGMIKAYGLPSLRPMLDIYYASPAANPRIERTMTFSHFGHGLYFCNANEVQKLTISSEFIQKLPDMRGTVFQDSIPMPEPPKQSFLKGLFGGAAKPLDREELFGETAGKVSSQMATHIPGTAGMTNLQSKSSNSGTEISKARMALVERGQKLNELDDMAEAMHMESKQYAQNAHALLQREKNRKWYQL